MKNILKLVIIAFLAMSVSILALMCSPIKTTSRTIDTTSDTSSPPLHPH